MPREGRPQETHMTRLVWYSLGESMSRWYMQKRVRRAKGGAHMFGVQNVWENRKRYHDECMFDKGGPVWDPVKRSKRADTIVREPDERFNNIVWTDGVTACISEWWPSWLVSISTPRNEGSPLLSSQHILLTGGKQLARWHKQSFVSACHLNDISKESNNLC